MDPANRPKTAFSTDDGLMLMGLKYPPPTFQRLSTVSIGQRVLYLDVVICMGHDFEDHL